MKKYAERLYFTFGSDPQYPYTRDDYVIAIGTDDHDCIKAFRKKHPNRPGSDAVNAASWYNTDKWGEISEKYYKDTAPKEILVSDTVYGTKPAGFDPIWFFVPATNSIICLQEGGSNNLRREDINKNNYVDYIDYSIYSLDDGCIERYDGGNLLLTRMVQEKYECLADAIPDILDMACDDMFLNVQILDA